MKLLPIFAGVLGAAVLSLASCSNKEDGLLEYPEFSGDFILTSSEGEAWKLSDTAGKVRLLFFGFTHCPDICPTTLVELQEVYRSLGTDSDQVETLFVSIDPERDTPELLKGYLNSFSIPVTGLTGTKAEIDAVVDQYAAFYDKVPLDSAAVYTMDHSTRSYLIDQEGMVRYIFRYEDGPERIAYMVRKLLP